MINGHAGFVIGVGDLLEAHRFISDFGLPARQVDADQVVYQLEEGSTVVIRSAHDPLLPPPLGDALNSLREICWGVDNQQSLDALKADLGRDIMLTEDSDGSVHFVDPSGIATRLRVFQRKPVLNCPEPINAPDAIRRLGKHRRWRKRCHPKVIQHIVYVVDDALNAARFYMHRLGFKLSDISNGVGYFLRAPGISEHHSIFFLQKGKVPGASSARPDHVSFGVEDIDEMMVGANYMDRRGWRKSMGPGRHRIGSALFYYFHTPFGLEFEYDTDNDHLDDHWQPLIWEPRFGMLAWIAGDMPPFWREEPDWNVRYVPDDHPVYAPDDGLAAGPGGSAQENAA